MPELRDDLAVECRGLTKTFEGFRAVDGIDFEVEKGMVFGFLGPNGAGKTTTIRMLSCLIRPTSGTAFVWGHDILTDYMSVKRTVGYLPESPGYYPEMTPVEFLRYFARLFRVDKSREKIEESLRRVGLYEERNLIVRSFSLGMRQRLNIARTLLHDPKLLVLDEPTSGLDPRGTREVRQLILDLGETGKTIFLCTHLLPEVEMICEKVGIVNRGRLVAMDTPDNLRRGISAANVITVELLPDGRTDEMLRRVESLEWVESARFDDDERMIVESNTTVEKRPELAKVLVESGAQLLSIDLKEPTLEDVFMSYTG